LPSQIDKRKVQIRSQLRLLSLQATLEFSRILRAASGLDTSDKTAQIERRLSRSKWKLLSRHIRQLNEALNSESVDGRELIYYGTPSQNFYIT